MTTKRFALVAASLSFSLLVAADAAGQESRWVPIAKDPATGVAAFLDTTTVQATDLPGYLVWVKMQIPKGAASSYSPETRMAMSRMEYDCDGRRLRIIAIQGYDADGNLTLGESTSFPEWEYVAPETMGEEMLSTTCASLDQGGAPLSP